MSTWKEKRREILIRDNFTCQNCKQFNPELGVVQLEQEDDEIELHEFYNNPDTTQNIYSISQSKTGYTFYINFGDCWPVFPIMQVHHRCYINGRETWNYDNADLITLCRKCHYSLHLKQRIPVFSEDYILIEEKLFSPVDQGSGRKHNCDEWTFIKKIGDEEYQVSNINPTITVLILEGEDSEDTVNKGKQALNRLIEKLFPLYSEKK